MVPAQVDKMRPELASLNHCAVPFLSRATVNLCWYYISNLYEYFYDEYIFQVLQQCRLFINDNNDYIIGNLP